jgi:hypothetical protein
VKAPTFLCIPNQSGEYNWFDEECAEATSLKNKAYKNMIAKRKTRRAREEYQRWRYEEKKTHRRKKRKHGRS